VEVCTNSRQNNKKRLFCSLKWTILFNFLNLVKKINIFITRVVLSFRQIFVKNEILRSQDMTHSQTENQDAIRQTLQSKVGKSYHSKRNKTRLIYNNYTYSYTVDSGSLAVFKSRLKTFLFRRTFHPV